VNLDRPEMLEEIAALYVDAGSDLVTTNTFGGSPLKLSQYGLEPKTREINESAVRAVRAIVGTDGFVGASVGPTGKMLKPYGDTGPDAVYGAFLRQVQCLVDAGSDLVLVETMIDLFEAKLAVKAVKDVSPDMPVTAAMTFDPTPRGFFTIMGVSIEQAATGLAEAGADLVGSNCGNGIENMVRIAADFRQCTALPLIIQSNAGLPKTVDGKLVYDETPAFMADKARQLVDLGVSVIGGCCGTTPEHIAAMRKMADSTRSR
jgi:5-methyltetrahydrofolate--homocysteine methyltransferase